MFVTPFHLIKAITVNSLKNDAGWVSINQAVQRKNGTQILIKRCRLALFHVNPKVSHSLSVQLQKEKIFEQFKSKSKFVFHVKLIIFALLNILAYICFSGGTIKAEKIPSHKINHLLMF